MRSVGSVIVLILLGFLGGCQFKVAPYEVQHVEVDFYEDFEANIDLAVAISQYAVEYYVFHIEGYDESFVAGITLGASADSTDGRKAYIRVRYDFGDPMMAARRSQLKQGFEEFIPHLAQSHAEKELVFEERGPAGRDWLKAVFGGKGQELYEDFSSPLKGMISSAEWKKTSRLVSKDLGDPLSLRFLGGQFYEAFESNPESISLYYLGEFVGEDDLSIRVSEILEDGEWRVVGFKWEPQTDN